MLNLKNEFPLLNNKEIIYLDSAATTQMPKNVIRAITNQMETKNANTRGMYTLAEEATLAVEEVRRKVAAFINAEPEEIIFTSGTTESINLIAERILPVIPNGRKEILVTELEHHANLIPWQVFCKKHGFSLKVVKITKDFALDEKDLMKKLNEKTALFAFSSVSNVTGTENDVQRLCFLAKKVGALTIIDAAQSIGNKETDVKKWGCDFLAFSSHKMYGPQGIGVLFGKKEHLDIMEPYQYGGGIIAEVTIQDSSFTQGPEKFEAGTLNIPGIVGLGVAIDFVLSNGLKTISEHEETLLKKLMKGLSSLKGIRLYTAPESKSILSFTLEGLHPHDVSDELSKKNICIRVGHMCAMPLMKTLGVASVCRVSIGAYTTEKDIDIFIDSLTKIIKQLKWIS